MRMFLEFSESFYQILLTFSFIRFIVNKSFYLSHAILIFIDFIKEETIAMKKTNNNHVLVIILSCRT